jgi:endonuclease-3
MRPDRKKQTEEVIRRLRKAYPDAHCALDHGNAFELLVATILSAQCTDVRVNIVTADLFRKYRSPADYLKVPQRDWKETSTRPGSFATKARNIPGCVQALSTKYGGEVPQTMDELLTLGGVARKTANVVLGNAFGIAAGVVVDTHVSRLLGVGLTKTKHPKRSARPSNAGAAKTLGDVPRTG